MINRLKRTSLVCGIALLMLAAFPVFAQDSAKEINRKPFRDFGAEIINRVQAGELVLSENFLVELDGELTKDGKLDLQKTRYVRTEGNEKMVDVAKSAIEAVNDSGLFVYLSDLKMNKINLILAQDDENIYAVINSDAVSETKAKSLSSALNMYFSIGKTQAADADTKTLLDGTKVTANGKTVTIKTSVEKSVGQEMIRREIEKESAKRQKTGTNK